MQNRMDGASFADKLLPNLSGWRASKAFCSLKVGLKWETNAQAGRMIAHIAWLGWRFVEGEAGTAE
jgi:hypothetical protein